MKISTALAQSEAECFLAVKSLFPPLLVFWPLLAQCSAQSHKSSSIPFSNDVFVQFH